jgi:hypothetical protein
VSFTPRPLHPRGKNPLYSFVGVWVYPRAGLDDVEKRTFLTLPGFVLRALGRQAVDSRYTDCATIAKGEVTSYRKNRQCITYK